MDRCLCVLLCALGVLILAGCENKSAEVITQPDNDTAQSSVITKPSLISAFEKGLKQDAVHEDLEWRLDIAGTKEKFLLAKKDLDVALKEAAKEDVITVRQLIDTGADINELDYLGRTPLMMAFHKKYDPLIINLLMDKGANVHLKTKNNDVTLLMYASDCPDTDIIKRLIASGIDVNAKTEEGMTALLYAAKDNPNPAIIRELVKAGADVTARDNEGFTVLHYAVVHNRTLGSRDVLIEVLKQTRNKYVLQNGRKVPFIDAKSSYGNTPLMVAAGNCMRQKYALLLKHGANPNLKDKDGSTAKRNLELMIEHDADSCYDGEPVKFW